MNVRPNFTRRSLMKGVAGSLAAPLVPSLLIPKLAKATTYQSAVYLDGNCVMQNPGNIPTLPATSNLFFGTFGFARSTPVDNPMYLVMMGLPTDNTGTFLAIQIAKVGNPPNQYTILQIAVVPSEQCVSGGPCFEAWTTVDSYLDGNVHQVLMSMDTTNYVAAITIDGQSQSVQTQICNCNQSGPGVNYQGKRILVGGQPGGSPTNLNWVGTLCEVALYAGMSISASDPNVIANFWDSSKGQAKGPFDASYQWVMGSNPQKIPQVALSEGPDFFLNNDPSSIGYNTISSDDPQNPFTLLSGSSPLLVADRDYWNTSGLGMAVRRPVIRTRRQYKGPPAPVIWAGRHGRPHVRHSVPG